MHLWVKPPLPLVASCVSQRERIETRAGRWDCKALIFWVFLITQCIFFIICFLSMFYWPVHLFCCLFVLRVAKWCGCVHSSQISNVLSSHSASWFKCSVTWTWIYSINAVPHRVFNFAKRLFQYIHFECCCVSHTQIHIFKYLSTRNDNSHHMTHALRLSEHFPSLWPSPLCDCAFAVAIFSLIPPSFVAARLFTRTETQRKEV